LRLLGGLSQPIILFTCRAKLLGCRSKSIF
jgi:hypothetical protein